jgi:hypothetical protein
VTATSVVERDCREWRGVRRVTRWDEVVSGVGVAESRWWCRRGSCSGLGDRVGCSATMSVEGISIYSCQLMI